MPDFELLTKALAAAGAAAFLLAAAPALLAVLVSGRLRPAFNSAWAAPASVLALAVGFYLGCWVVGMWPHWPPVEDKDRFLALILPAMIVVELLGALPRTPRLLLWPLRLLVMAGAARILLHGSTYLTDLIGPNSREWSPAQTWLILGGLAAALVLVWILLEFLGRHGSGLLLPLILGMTCGAAALTVMLSGYSTGGQPGLPMAAALAGVAAAGLVLPRPPGTTPCLGPAIVGLYGLLVIGHFFGKLTTTHALLLFGAPLLAWISEFPPCNRLRPWCRGLIQVVLVAALAAVVVTQAKEQFDRDSRPTPSNSNEPSIQDYMDFGK
jgi:hypothetical protein